MNEQNAKNKGKNSKYEARNSKQIPMTKILMTKTKKTLPIYLYSSFVLKFEHFDFGFILVLRSGLFRRVASDFDIRISDLSVSFLGIGRYWWLKTI